MPTLTFHPRRFFLARLQRENRFSRITAYRKAFTLVELLVVIAIMGMLIAMILPVLMSTHEMSRRMQCRNNLTQIALALEDYHAYFHTFPPGTTALSGPVQSLPDDLHHSWLVRLLPQLDKPNLYEAIDFGETVYSKANASARAVPVSEFLCPSDDADLFRIPPSSYAGSHHHVESPIDKDNTGVLFLNIAIGADQLVDGRAQTIAAGEKIWQPGDLGWTSGTKATLRNTGHPLRDPPPNPNLPKEAMPQAPERTFVGGFRSRHPGRVNFLFADGVVQSLENEIDQKVLQSLANRADGAPLSWPLE
jgi:prepilin-type N-terminal cleavage/methylation domain-containing protein/prepilin-type processing-associated H-X9-DG protein